MAILTRLGKVLTTDIMGESRQKKNESAIHDKDLLHFMKQRRTFNRLGALLHKPSIKSLFSNIISK